MLSRYHPNHDPFIPEPERRQDGDMREAFLDLSFCLVSSVLFPNQYFLAAFPVLTHKQLLSSHL